jgi:transcription initiation factor TFIIIB Brf1 subunit/transcription initiation factor TFIIB
MSAGCNVYETLRRDGGSLGHLGFNECVVKNYVENVALKLLLPREVVGEAVEVYLKAKGKIRGVRKTDLALASLIFAAKQTSCPVNARQILSAADEVQLRLLGALNPERQPCFGKHTTVLRLFRRLLQLFNKGLNSSQLTPTIYLENMLSKLRANDKARRIAAELNGKVIEKKLHVGRNPTATAAAIVYLAMKEAGTPLAQRKLARMAGISNDSMVNIKKCLQQGLIHDRGKLPL